MRFWGKLPDVSNLKKFGKEVVIKKDDPEHKFGPRGPRAVATVEYFLATQEMWKATWCVGTRTSES